MERNRTGIRVIAVLAAALALSLGGMLRPEAVTAALAASITVNSGTTTWSGGNTYVVSGNVSMGSSVTVSGSAVLKLEAGCRLEVPGITVNSGNTLTIQGSGELITNAQSNFQTTNVAGIGGCNSTCGTVIIEGGTITATGSNNGAGIGGGGASGGTIRISGGHVTAYGGEEAAGIGGGQHGEAGTIEISGGTVAATGGIFGGAGIGGGNMYSQNTNTANGSVTVSGGTVTATGGAADRNNSENEGGPGIGSGKSGACKTVSITGGTVTASGTHTSAIRVSDKAGSSISVSGGKVTANGTLEGKAVNLSWTTKSADYIKAGGISGNSEVTLGKNFLLQSNNLAWTEDLKKSFELTPYVGATYTITLHDVDRNGNATTISGAVNQGGTRRVSPENLSGQVFLGWFAEGATAPTDLMKPIRSDLELTAHRIPLTNRIDSYSRAACDTPGAGALLGRQVDTVWYANAESNVCCFHMDTYIRPTGYVLRTVRDAEIFSHPEWLPGSWTLEGRKTPDGEWTMLANVTNDIVLRPYYQSEFGFPISGCDEDYRYFRFTVTNLGAGDQIRLNHLDLCGTNVDHGDCTITWKKDENDPSPETSTVAYGNERPAKEGPAKEEDARYSYAFAGWSDGNTTYAPGADLPYALADTTYTATYTLTPKVYTVTYLNEDGSVWQVLTREYGEAAYLTELPSKPGDGEYDLYTVTGWTDGEITCRPEGLDTVTGNAVLRPVFSGFDPADFILPADIESIGEYAFAGISAERVYIPDGCTSVGDYAFKDCAALKQIRIPAGCSVSPLAFDGCGENLQIFKADAEPGN